VRGYADSDCASTSLVFEIDVGGLTDDNGYRQDPRLSPVCVEAAIGMSLQPSWVLLPPNASLYPSSAPSLAAYTNASSTCMGLDN
jgi:hypothetical protein